MTEKDLLIQDMREKIKKLEEQKQEIIDYIDKKCVYDEHLQGYCFDLKKGEVRTLMYKLKGDNKNERSNTTTKI